MRSFRRASHPVRRGQGSCSTVDFYIMKMGLVKEVERVE